MEQQLGMSVAAWLREQAKESENAASLESAAKMVEDSLSCQKTTASFLASTSPKTLDEVFSAGLSVLFTGPVTLGERLSLAEKDATFVTFEETVASKGFYKDVTVGSLEYLERRAKLLQKYMERTGSTLGGGGSGGSSAKTEEEAEDKKGLGNTAMTAKDYDLAVQFYTEAIELSRAGPNSHIYFSNRAAAYCSLKKWNDAIKDCKDSLQLVPDFTKAVARLGLANFYAENFDDAVAAYEHAMVLEPENKAHSEALAKAKAKLTKKQTGRRDAPSSSSSSSSSSAVDMMAGLGGMGGAGGLGSLLSNPSMMAMAQNMMKNPAMMQKAQEMMKDPSAMAQAMSMLGGGGGGGDGGMDLGALMGALGGADGGGKGFKGFEE